jgi:hypothetical protein
MPPDGATFDVVRALAEAMAARGVLVPGTLTEREVAFLVLGIDHGRNMLPGGPDMGKPVREVLAERLRRIAIGDAP